MTLLEDVVRWTAVRMSRNLHSQDAFDMRRDLDNPQRYAIGLYRWAELVWPRGDWDFKKEIAETFGHWCLHAESNTLFNFDIWANIHYGYVGSSLGMGQWLLEAGGGFGQLVAGTIPSGYWARRFERLGDADFMAAFEDPVDRHAVILGIELWQQYPEGVSWQDLQSAVLVKSTVLHTKKASE